MVEVILYLKIRLGLLLPHTKSQGDVSPFYLHIAYVKEQEVCRPDSSLALDNPPSPLFT
jgi:hypothetical protein